MRTGSTRPTLFDDDLRPRFSEPVARRTDPPTSWRAARGVDGNNDRRRAYDALAAAGTAGMTDFELGAAIGRQQTSAGKRRHELMTCSPPLVEWAGTTRPAPSGAQARCWRLIAAVRPVEDLGSL